MGSWIGWLFSGAFAADRHLRLVFRRRARFWYSKARKKSQ
jgi:hypothetical protein